MTGSREVGGRDRGWVQDVPPRDRWRDLVPERFRRLVDPPRPWKSLGPGAWTAPVGTPPPGHDHVHWAEPGPGAVQALRDLAVRMGHGALLWSPVPVVRRKTHAVDRTRSARARAGSRRTGRLARSARRLGRPTPFQSPLKGFRELGFTQE